MSAQTAGSLDVSFASGAGGNGPVHVIAEQADGALLIGGEFTAWDGVARSGLARLHADGRLDTAFNPLLTHGTPLTVSALIAQSDGSILVGGTFSTVNGIPQPALARLRSDGGTDASFISPFTRGNTVLALLPAGDGGIFAAGNFSFVAGLPRVAVARLLSTGSVDTSYGPLLAFATTTGLSPIPPAIGFALERDSEGRLLLTGSGLSQGISFGDIRLRNPLRFTPAGALDEPFLPRSFSEEVWTIAAGLNSALWVGDYSLRRLRTDATYDPAFAPVFSLTNGPLPSIRRVLPEPDGKVIAAGQFDRVNDVARAHLVRLLPDGSIDSRFAPDSALNGSVRALVRDRQGRLLIGGDFTQVQGTPRARVARLLNPALPPRIQLPPSARSVTSGSNTRLAVTTDPEPGLRYQWLRNGEPLSGATDRELFLVSVTSSAAYSVEVSNAAGIARSSPVTLTVTPRLAGAADPSFAPALPTASSFPVAFGTGGRIYLKVGNTVARVNSDLTADPGFSLDLPANVELGSDGVELEDGRLLLKINGALRRYLPDGKIDSSFTFRGFTSANVALFRPLPDGRIVLAGTFASGSTPRLLARLDADGQNDASFQPAFAQSSGTVFQLLVQPDGKILYRGLFSSSPSIIRLLADGALDPTWTVFVETLDLLGGDGALYRSDGLFGELRRIRADGTTDVTFRCKVSNVEIRSSGSRFERAVAPAIAALRDGRLLLTGGFNSVNGSTVPGIAVIDRQGVLDAGFIPHAAAFPFYQFVRQNGEFVYVLYDYFAEFRRTTPQLIRLFLDGGGSPRMVNLATRARADVGSKALVAGFVLRGAPAQPILARGIGPALAGFGLADILVAPRLELFRASASICTNLAWGADAGPLASAASRVGAFALASGSADTALWSLLSEGTYTAEIRPQSGPGGTALAEVYSEEILPGAELVNLATRADVSSSSPVVAGFTLRGSGVQQVLIRAIGPTLAAFGVPGSLTNPKLSVIRDRAIRATNDDWSLDPNAGFAASAASQVGAFALPLGSHDAAILLTLEAGAYTAIVESADAQGGIALVEVYSVKK